MQLVLKLFKIIKYSIDRILKNEYYIIMNNIVLKIIVIMFFIAFCSCQKNKENSELNNLRYYTLEELRKEVEELKNGTTIKSSEIYENKDVKINLKIGEIKILCTDYEIINFSKIIKYIEINNHEGNVVYSYYDEFEITLEIKIINEELFFNLSELFDPIINIEIDGIHYLVKDIKNKNSLNWSEGGEFLLLLENVIGIESLRKYLIENMVIK
jgi:hypothetical protein